MNRRFRSLLLLACAVFILLYLYRDTSPVEVGAFAPAFRLPDDRGELHSLEDYRGNVVLLNFWATWCPPCLEELPDLETLYRKLREEGFTVIAVNRDGSDLRTSLSQVSLFQKRVPFSFLSLYDTGGEVAEKYGVHSLPASYLISREGKMLERILGLQKWTSGPLFDKIRASLEENETHP